MPVDGGRAIRLGAGDTVQVACSPYETQLVRLKDRSFFDIVNHKFRNL